METIIKLEIKDNAFARQFETKVETGVVSVEYSFQEKKIFLTKINTPELFDDEEFISNYLKNIMEIPCTKSYFLLEYAYKKKNLFIYKQVLLYKTNRYFFYLFLCEDCLVAG
jgi:hypothetical protein